MKGVLKKKDDQIVYHTDGRAIALKNLEYFEIESEHKTLRYYIPREISFFSEPETKVYDEIFGAIRRGDLSFDEAEKILKERSQEDVVDHETIEHAIGQARGGRRTIAKF